MTFAELRRRMEEARRRPENSHRLRLPSLPVNRKKTPDIQIDFNLKPSGQQKNINGYDCRELVMTISVHEKGKPLEQGEWSYGSRLDRTEDRRDEGNRRTSLCAFIRSSPARTGLVIRSRWLRSWRQIRS